MVCVCRPEPECWLGNVEWKLDVANVDWIVDMYVWNRIIGNKTCPDSLWNQWTQEAIEAGDNAGNYREKMFDEYLSKPAPEGG